jgi:uncharacterized membrane protein
MKKNKLKIRENTVVHCPTEELANEVLSLAHKLGYKWSTGIEYVEENCWSVYKKDTCYNLIEGSFALIRYYESQRKTIITAEEFIKLHKK